MRSRWALPVVMVVLALTIGCGGSSSTLSGNTDVLSAIPWGGDETARYRALDGKDEIGSAELSLRQEDGTLTMKQAFSFPDEEIMDTATVVADPETLAPRTVERLISGPEGDRSCDAAYGESTVTVEQRSENDERTDELDVPIKAFDTWTDLFLWRTLAFAEGYEVKYSDALTCSLAKPEVLSVVLKVKGTETVPVPAGTFETWRLEIRSGGRTQKAWYSTDAARTLVRYDNGELVFELEEVLALQQEQ